MFEVSTHSRPKAAGAYQSGEVPGESVSTHSRPKAAGMAKYEQRFFVQVSTHSRPKAAGISREMTTRYTEEFQLTAARRRLEITLLHQGASKWFQLTAARRRLERRTKEN